jgi:hypothetical protein
MRVNQTEAKWLAAEFAALSLDRSIKRGEFSRFVRHAAGVTGNQPASSNNATSAAKELVDHLWKRSTRDPAEWSRRIVPLFDELFPAAATDAEREEMARALEATLSKAGRR